MKDVISVRLTEDSLNKIKFIKDYIYSKINYDFNRTMVITLCINAIYNSIKENNKNE